MIHSFSLVTYFNNATKGSSSCTDWVETKSCVFVSVLTRFHFHLVSRRFGCRLSVAERGACILWMLCAEYLCPVVLPLRDLLWKAKKSQLCSSSIWEARSVISWMTCCIPTWSGFRFSHQNLGMLSMQVLLVLFLWWCQKQRCFSHTDKNSRAFQLPS